MSECILVVDASKLVIFSRKIWAIKKETNNQSQQSNHVHCMFLGIANCCGIVDRLAGLNPKSFKTFDSLEFSHLVDF